jgi:alkylation response protein AidB-like acyl-CoA dehydrogenase
LTASISNLNLKNLSMAHIYEIDATGEHWTESARKLAQTVAGPAAADVDEQGRFPTEAAEKLAELGFLGLCVPVEFGGQGQPPRVFASVVEEIAMGCSSTAMIYVMHVAASTAIVASTTLSRRGELLSEIAKGRHLTTLAFSEAGSRSQFWAPMSYLQQHGGGYMTTAKKSWVTAARHADLYVSSAMKPDAASPTESTLYLVARKSPGVNVTRQFNGLGLRGNDSAPVQLDSAQIAAGDLLTELGAGAGMMLGIVLPWFVIGTAAMANGLCRAATELTKQHLTNTGFDHTGQRLRDLPNLRSRLAEMSLYCEQSRAFLGRVLKSMEANDPQTPLLILQCRAAAISAAVEVTDLAMKTCGGTAFSRDLPIERLFRDARAGWVMSPTVDHLLDFVGRLLTGLPLFDG